MEHLEQYKKDRIANILGIVFFYLLIVIGVIGLNARFEQINGQTKSTNEPPTQIVQNQNR